MSFSNRGRGTPSGQYSLGSLPALVGGRGLSLTPARSHYRAVQVTGRDCVISTPGVVIDGKVVHVGSAPSREKIEQWLADA
jgi:hypothetical protein